MFITANVLLSFNLLVSEYGLMDLTEQKARRSELNIKVSENLLTWLSWCMLSTYISIPLMLLIYVCLF